MKLAVADLLQARPGLCTRTRGIKALFFILGPTTLASAPLTAYGPHPWAVALLLAGVFLLAASKHRLGHRWPRFLASIAFLPWAFGILSESVAIPDRGLFVLLFTTSFYLYIWPPDRIRRFNAGFASKESEKDLLLASVVALMVGIDAWQTGSPDDLFRTIALTATYLAPAGLLWARHVPGRAQRLALDFGIPLATAPLWKFLGLPVDLAPVAMTTPVLVFLVVTRRSWLRRITSGESEPTLMDVILAQPARVLVVSFFALCAIGTMLLRLPVSSSGAPIGWLEAAFTSVSASCVTGLAVLDTQSAFSEVGQFFILLLIQVGGLGVMVFSAAAVVVFGRRLSLSHESAAVDLVGATSRANLASAVRAIYATTFITEGIIAVLLAIGFMWEGDSIGRASWRGIFTSISAFCNAGFALQSDSLVRYNENSFILTIVSIAIILGGLGPAVVTALWSWREKRRRTLHARLVLWTSAILILVPAVFFALVEWNQTLMGLPVHARIANAVFQSVTTRTAGFNSFDLSAMAPASWSLTIVLMFIGGSPGSTAGGIKTTSFVIIVLAIAAVVRGRERIEIFNRTLPIDSVMRAIAVTAIGVVSAFVMLVVLQLTQEIPLPALLFEVVSALGTVGLSVGATPMLDEVGQLIIMACMFAGRVGPLTLLVFLALRADSKTNYHYAEENIPIG